MATRDRLTEVFKSTKKIININDDSKIILFSDCHRGDNSWADDFARNQNIFFYALKTYCEEGYTYIELGDGDELWENKMKDIKQAHIHIFWLLSKLYMKNQIYLIWGNHNRKWKNKNKVKKHLSEYYYEKDNVNKPLFKNEKTNEKITIHEGIILRYKEKGNEILLVHGHQMDPLNDTFWWVGRFLLRNVWKPLQLAGVKDPTSPAKNFKVRGKVEKRLLNWVKSNKQMVIAGHTHRSVFPKPGPKPYFNTGSCVHPRCITGIEIRNGNIRLIKWFTKVRSNGTLFIGSEKLEGPVKLDDFFKAVRKV